MKKHIYTLAVAALALCACAQNEGFKISGQAGEVNGEAALEYTTPEGEEVSLSAPVKDGAFKFEGSVSDAVMGVITIIPEGEDPMKGSIVVENAALKADLDMDKIIDYAQYGGKCIKNVVVKGGVNGDFLYDLQAAQDSVGHIDQFAAFAAAQGELEDMGYADMAAYQAKSAEIQENFTDVMDAYHGALKTAIMDCILSHPDAPVAAYYFDMYGSSLSLEELEASFYAFTPEVQESFLAKGLKDEITARKATAPGAVAPDFTLKDPQGNDVTLSTLRGQYVLVDFWASWCKPCRAGVPGLKELYAKYHDKGFEIIGVSDDSDYDKWVKAIEEDQSPWIHTIDEFPEENKPARVSTLYATHYIPAYFLLDKDGVIIGQVDHDQLAEKLAELLGE